MTTPKSLKSISLQHARDTVISLNLVDKEILHEFYPHGCTIAEAGQILEAVSHSDTDEESILDEPTTDLIDAFIAALDGDGVINQDFYGKATANQAEAFRQSIKLILLGFRTLPLPDQAQHLAQGLACELDARPAAEIDTKPYGAESKPAERRQKTK